LNQFLAKGTCDIKIRDHFDRFEKNAVPAPNIDLLAGKQLLVPGEVDVDEANSSSRGVYFNWASSGVALR